MNRLEKKCFITAVAAHGLLVVILFVGPAFFTPSEKTDSFKPITVYSSADVSKAMSSGGTPEKVTAVPLPLPPAPIVPEPKRVETPQPPEIPKPAKPEPHDLEPPKPVIKATKPIDRGDEPAPRKKPVTKLDPDELVSSVPDRDKARKKANEEAQARARARAAAETRQRAEDAKRFGDAIKDLNNNLSHSTTVHFDPGVGGGGRATINYFQLVQSMFDNAWHPSQTLGDDTPTATISVTISRDGSVRGHISKHSGNSSMDKSIQNVLDTVTSVEPFPPSFSEQQITASFTFDIKAKR